jgi:hypothetical protein
VTARVAQLVAIRLEGTPQNPERAAFMASLSEHEDLVADAATYGYTAPRVERIRLSRRAVVAAYDRMTLGTVGPV